VLELVATEAALVAVVGDARAAAAVGSLDGAVTCPVAPDEALLIGPPDARERLAKTATERATSADPDALVVDVTDGWAVWTLEGEGLRAAFSRLSPLTLPDRGFTQGDVARVAVKIVVDGPRLHMVVPVMWGDYLHDRIIERCRSLGVHERSAAASFAAPESGP
jgi:sarcosine oxidase gamma subunit